MNLSSHVIATIPAQKARSALSLMERSSVSALPAMKERAAARRSSPANATTLVIPQIPAEMVRMGQPVYATVSETRFA